MERDGFWPPRYMFPMSSNWLHDALEGAKISQAELSRILTDALGRSVDRAAVNKMVKGTRSIALDEAQVIERVTGYEAPNEITVPLLGDIGAGAEVLAIEGDGHDTAPAPRDTKPGTVAVRVKGDSMHPAYEPGTLIYYSRQMPPAELLNKRAVVQLGDDRIFVKIIRAGSRPDLWNLSSLNPLYPEMTDQVVAWAAPIDWIKPL